MLGKIMKKIFGLKQSFSNSTKKNSRSSSEIPLLKVYSHPRSGTHFLEAFLAENFYEDLQLSVDEVLWGHWSNRVINKEGNPYGKLFGNHYFPERNENDLPKIYIFRDGRAVAYSIWRTQNFLNKDMHELSFDQFLDTKLDWYGTPAEKSSLGYTILEHWAHHVAEWKAYSLKSSSVYLIKYEDLFCDPYVQYQKIRNKFFKERDLKPLASLKLISEPVGLYPNKAVINSWEQYFRDDKLEKFRLISSKYKINEYNESSI